MAKLNFNSVVAARTRAANQILSTPDLVAKYVALGGLSRDLETIRKAGLEAEAANLGQSQSHSAGKSATVDILASFAGSSPGTAGPWTWSPSSTISWSTRPSSA